MELRIATSRPLAEPDHDEDLLLEALARRGIHARMAAWHDPDEDWDAPVPTVIRSTWDYIHAVDAFRAWVARAARAAPLWNPGPVVLGNLHKGYLLDLARRGVPVVPTELVARGSAPDLAVRLRDRAWSDLVIKPAVGAASFGARRFGGGDRAAAGRFLSESARAGDVLVQPYLASVDGHGERALVWIDGVFTHAVRKTPRFSGEDECVSAAVAIEPAERALGERALAPYAEELLYARVDVAPGPDGEPCVMELELVEPSLFLKQHPPALERLAGALAQRLVSASA